MLLGVQNNPRQTVSNTNRSVSKTVRGKRCPTPTDPCPKQSEANGVQRQQIGVRNNRRQAVSNPGDQNGVQDGPPNEMSKDKRPRWRPRRPSKRDVQKQATKMALTTAIQTRCPKKGDQDEVHAKYSTRDAQRRRPKPASNGNVSNKHPKAAFRTDVPKWCLKLA